MPGSTSLCSLECAPPLSDSGQRAFEGETTATPAPRKLGRPLWQRTPATSADSSVTSNSVRQTTCVRHTQVERKYRESINMRLERLRRAVATLPQAVGADAIGVAKPSKGIVLAAAIDYVGRIERERDAAMDEIERLAGDVRTRQLERY
ncbi:hypothetical protein COCMIDRAFT_108367 [Bipolaris oryzae ATCC 44560]|uniref:BHLH domain-containing protein n=1 Tax=Bipolaris oryzae ATCC 44560 TaxID=930090 RepID=W6YYF9_COCMI|nr:uncharacterized protein COCMIDRAFT_108367 [Bipolaris oryzae ATCC 44560]EUC40599.1 hypothetical protein COCMIDRAFT_108367 [Bipolaris oryzae ATCC 44560]